MTRILEADNRLVTGTIMNRLFSPTEDSNEFQHRVFGFWNGSDGLVPPSYMGNTFDSSTTHYFASGASALDSGDIEDMIRVITLKVYGLHPGSQLLILANPAESDLIQGWRAGVESRSSGPKAKWDLIPSSNVPPFLTNETVVGAIPPANYAGVPVQGSYGPAWVLASNFVPSGYVAVVASGGPNSPDNPIAVRQHPNPAYQGLRHIPGNSPHPIQDSFMVRGFWVGTRHRGAAAVTQVTTNGSYTAPTFAV